MLARSYDVGRMRRNGAHKNPSRAPWRKLDGDGEGSYRVQNVRVADHLGGQVEVRMKREKVMGLEKEEEAKRCMRGLGEGALEVDIVTGWRMVKVRAFMESIRLLNKAISLTTSNRSGG